MRISGGGDYLNLEDQVATGFMHTDVWPNFADSIRDIFENGLPTTDDISLEIDRKFLRSLAKQQAETEARSGIRCGDSSSRAHQLSEMFPLFEEIQSIAPSLGDIDSNSILNCAAWQLTAKDRCTMPFEKFETKNPILFIGNTYDPGTPLASARNASAAFPGSALLTLDGYGHCSTSQPSLCVGKAVKAYFKDGTLPEEGAVCQPSVSPFRNNTEMNLLTAEMYLFADNTTDDDAALLAAWTHVGREMGGALGLF